MSPSGDGAQPTHIGPGSIPVTSGVVLGAVRTLLIVGIAIGMTRALREMKVIGGQQKGSPDVRYAPLDASFLSAAAFPGRPDKERAMNHYLMSQIADARNQALRAEADRQRAATGAGHLLLVEPERPTRSRRLSLRFLFG